MTERDWRTKIKKRDNRIAELEAILAGSGDVDEIKSLRDNLKGAKMQIGRLKAQIKRLEA